MQNISRYSTNPIGPEFSRLHLDPELDFLARRNSPILISLTGPSKSGKTIAAKYLVTEYGFRYESLITPMRVLARRLGSDKPTWEKLGDLAVTLRSREENDILAVRALNRISSFRNSNRFVFDGVLHPDEVKTMLSLQRSYLIGISASAEFRVKHAREWYSLGDESFAEELLKRDKFEQVSRQTENNPCAPNIRACMARSDFKIEIRDKFCQTSLIDPLDKIIRRILYQL